MTEDSARPTRSRRRTVPIGASTKASSTASVIGISTSRARLLSAGVSAAST
eukprot:gene13531-13651_t